MKKKERKKETKERKKETKERITAEYLRLLKIDMGLALAFWEANSN